MRIQPPSDRPPSQTQLSLAPLDVRRSSGTTPKLKQFIARPMGREKSVRKADAADASKDGGLPSRNPSANDSPEQTFSSTQVASNLATAAAISISKSQKNPLRGIGLSMLVSAAGGFLLGGGTKNEGTMYWDMQEAVKSGVGAAVSAGLTSGFHYFMPTTKGKNLATSLKKVTSPITNLGKGIIDPALSFRLIDAGPTLKESIQREVPSAAFSPGYFTGTFIDKIYPSDQESKYGALLQNPEASAKSSLSKAL